MSFFHDNSNPPPPDDSNEPLQPQDDLADRIVIHSPVPGEPSFSEASPGAPAVADPISVFIPPPAPPDPYLAHFPEDLRITWSWLHLLFFGLFAFGSLIVIQLSIVLYYAAGRQLNQKQMEQIFQNNPQLAIGSNVLWFFLIFLYLYVTLAAIRDRPFWPTLKWKKLDPEFNLFSKPWVFFACGIGLAICVAIGSAGLKTPEHLPIQDLFKNRTGAFLLMGMAVFIAPLVEETVFRGYLYPLFALNFARAAAKFGSDPARAVRTGTGIAIALTGTLFGLLHGAQLGWTWGLVAMLVTVGIIFTYARARAGTVLASFLLHLGYNSFIAFSAIVATRGFTQMPHP
jgi:membrane protease YdiL (CAAX protease family)